MPDPTKPRTIDPSKIAAVYSYFEPKFPGQVITDYHETDTITQVFTVEPAGTLRAHRVKVSREFLDDNTPQKIEQKLMRWRTAEFVKASKAAYVDVTSNGISAEEG